jgi:hypothetical protein
MKKRNKSTYYEKERRKQSLCNHILEEKKKYIYSVDACKRKNYSQYVVSEG